MMLAALGKSFSSSEVIAAVQSHGSDAEDLRDAAHEAAHALHLRMRGSWDRESIHRAVMSKSRRVLRHFRAAWWFEGEVLARSVEALVCHTFSVDYDLRRWSSVACMEAIKFDYPYAGIDPTEFAALVAKQMERRDATQMATRIIELGAKR